MKKGQYNQFIICLFAFLMLSALPLPLLANGGPVRWTDAGPMGGLVPVKPKGVQLEREELALTIPDAYSYQAHATYHLRKSSTEPQTVLFGLPLIVPDGPLEQDISEEDKQKAIADVRKKIADAAQGVELKLGNTRFPCRPVTDGKATDFTPAPALAFPIPEEQTGALVQENVGDREHYLYTNYHLGKRQTPRAWCIAEVALPAQAGPLILNLRYKGSLVFEDEMTSKSPLTLFDSRRLVYPLFPAQSWAADDFVADASLDLGPFVGEVKKALPEAVEKEAKLRWRLTKSDLSGAILVDLGEKNIRFQELATWNRNAEGNARLKLEATSAQALPNYPAELATDGKPETAWCFSDKTGKPDAEITLRVIPAELKRIRGQSCSSTHVSIATGYWKNQKVYEANGKILDAEMRTCDGKMKKTVLNGPISIENIPSDYRDAQLHFFDTESGFDAASELRTGCIKIRILKTKSSSAGDTCVSEIIPIPDCFGTTN